MNEFLPDAWQMSNLTNKFYERLDVRDHPGVLACFAQDGVWYRRGKPNRGHAAIQAALEARPADFHVFHSITNIQVEQASATEGAVVFCMTGFPFVGNIPEGGHVAPPPAHIVCIFRDSMRKIDGRWLIVEKKLVRTAYKDDQDLH